MAISKGKKRVEVTISINGVTAKEYEDTKDKTEHKYPNQTVLRYIEAISDANFVIVNEVLPAYKLKSDLEFRIQIDNKISTSQAFWAEGKNHGMVDGIAETDISGKMQKRLFKFASIVMVDVQDKTRIQRDVAAAANLGELRVSVFRTKILNPTTSGTSCTYDDSPSHIAEKAIKGQALSHCAGFGKAVGVSNKVTMYGLKPARGCSDPIAVFVFRYRSKEILQYLRLIPRSPIPDSLDQFSAEEIRQMARERLFGKEGKDENLKIKREDDRNWGIKHKFTNDDEVLTIDITGDDEVETRTPKKPKPSVDLMDD